ncbi:MAG: VWA domain-containing protein [Saprospiraceae bacterium]|nr:VWA domain-containing protein [Saprospiraceae bacterium]
MKPAPAAANILESFTVTMENVEIRDLTETSMQLRSDSCAYFIKLEPNKEGKVIFALSGIGYTSTARVSNLQFGVEITGYDGDHVVYPTFSIDEINQDIRIENNRLIFKWINGSLPVWFDQAVDSINMRFSNSHQLHVNQYLGIRDLRIVPAIDLVPNPAIPLCQEQTVMIGIDGSSSIDKKERNLISSNLLRFVRRSGFTRDSNTLGIVEFGTDIHAMTESMERRTLIGAVKEYKKCRHHNKKFTSWTNWSAVFDEAIRRKPDLFIFITDGWSNWSDQGPTSFSAQFESLVSKCNTLKSNGTRILFIASDINRHSHAAQHLRYFLNGNRTVAVTPGMFASAATPEDVDLITLERFASMSEVDFSLLFSCPDEAHDVAMSDKE